MDEKDAKRLGKGVLFEIFIEDPEYNEFLRNAMDMFLDMTRDDALDDEFAGDRGRAYSVIGLLNGVRRD